MVPIDKTKEWIGVKTAKYIGWMKRHLDKKFKAINHERLTEMFAKANALLKKF